jgi:3'(2'), 5'-bisphosphate nucleotidase
VIEEGWWQATAQQVIALIESFRGRLGMINVSSKADNTPLTEADVAVQEMIIQRIREFDDHSLIIAEEDGVPHNARVAESTGVWVVDPIDGTSQFVLPDAVDFCTAIARYEEGLPVAALIVAPEWGADRSPLVIEVSLEDKRILVNQDLYCCPPIRGLAGCASTTRRAGSVPSDVEKSLLGRNYEVKTLATSQTLDMVRTAIDLTSYAPHAKPFDLFHRREQKLWDGAAGICLAMAAGLTVADEVGEQLLPLSSDLLRAELPVLASSVIGHPELVVDICGSNRLGI